MTGTLAGGGGVPGRMALRPLALTDEATTFAWQGYPSVRRYFRNPSAPTAVEHAAWLARRVENKTDPAWIVLCDDRPVGMVRADHVDTARREVSILIAPDAQGRGMGRAALDLLAATYPFCVLQAEVAQDNVASEALFAKAGYAHEEASGFLVRPPQFGPRFLPLWADAGGTVGLGHVRRCLGLAQACKTEDIHPVLFVQPDASLAGSLADETSVDIHVLTPGAQPVWVFEGARVVVVDHYGADFSDMAAKAAFRVIAVDDNANRPLPVHAVINGSPGALALPYPEDMKARSLLGPDYQVIRPDLIRPDGATCRRSACRALLVTIGGSDPLGIAGVLLAAVCRVLDRWPDLSADFVIARACDVPAVTHDRLRCRVNPTDMARLISAADIAVSAGGQTMFELAYCGVPSVVFRVAENQALNTQAMAARMCIADIGWATDENWTDKVESILNSLLSDSEERARLAKAAMDVFDDRGGIRIRDKIKEWMS